MVESGSELAAAGAVVSGVEGIQSAGNAVHRHRAGYGPAHQWEILFFRKSFACIGSVVRADEYAAPAVHQFYRRARVCVVAEAAAVGAALSDFARAEPAFRLGIAADSVSDVRGHAGSECSGGFEPGRSEEHTS